MCLYNVCETGYRYNGDSEEISPSELMVPPKTIQVIVKYEIERIY